MTTITKNYPDGIDPGSRDALVTGSAEVQFLRESMQAIADIAERRDTRGSAEEIFGDMVAVSEIAQQQWSASVSREKKREPLAPNGETEIRIVWALQELSEEKLAGMFGDIRDVVAQGIPFVPSNACDDISRIFHIIREGAGAK